MSHTTHFDDCGCKTARYEARVAELEAHAAMLRDALREFTPGGVPHNGVACALREFAAERQRASGKWDGRSETLVQWAIAIEAALASTPAASLAAYRAEVLEQAAIKLERLNTTASRDCAAIVRALAAQAQEVTK